MRNSRNSSSATSALSILISRGTSSCAVAPSNSFTLPGISLGTRDAAAAAALAAGVATSIAGILSAEL
jgi:hypothetical protein